MTEQGAERYRHLPPPVRLEDTVAGKETDPALPRMGERLRLRRDFDVSSFPPHAQAILRALQTYGMFVADNGADWLLSIAPDRRIQGLESLERVKGSDRQAMQVADS